MHPVEIEIHRPGELQLGAEKTAIARVLAKYDQMRGTVERVRHLARLAGSAIDADVQRAASQETLAQQQSSQSAETALAKALQAADLTFNDRLQREVLAPIQQAERTIGILAAPWTNPLWDRFQPSSSLQAPVLPGVVRAGTLNWANGAVKGDAPALLPFVGSKSVLITAQGAALNSALSALQSTTLRLIATFPTGGLRLTLIDPTGVGQNLKDFLRLPESMRREKVFSDAREIEAETQRLLGHVETVTQTRLLDAPTIERYHAAVEEVSVPYQLLVIVNFPAGFSDTAAATLIRLAQNGPRTGTYFIATVDTSIPASRGVDMAALGAHCSVISSDGSAFRWNDPLFAAFPLTLDALPPAGRIHELLQKAGDAAKQSTSRGVAFSKVAIPRNKWWRGNSKDGLFIDIGLDGKGQPHRFELGSELVHHGMIGGATRMGKTNLLHVLLIQLALAYPPSELQLYLVDLKEGVEFQDYVTLGLPHARVITIAHDPEFGLSVLFELQREIERRGELFRHVNASTVKEYRETDGHPPLARIVLAIDEFQILFGDSSAHSLSQPAMAALADLVKRGAAFGIHVLLSSQSPTSSFTGNREAMNQLALRIALRCAESDARAILGENNDAAKFLERPGEAIYNAGNGLAARNVFVQVARLEPADRKQLLSELKAEADQPASKTLLFPEPSIVFAANTSARLIDNRDFRGFAENPAAALGEPLHIWLGEAIAIKPHTSAEVERRGRAHLLIAGQDEETGQAMLAAAIMAICAQRRDDARRIMLLNFGRGGQRWSQTLSDLPAHLPGIEIIAPIDASVTIERLRAMVERRKGGEPTGQDVILVIAGIDRFDALRETDKYNQPGPTAAAFLQILADGPFAGVHVLAWSATYSALEGALRPKGAQLFGLRVAMSLPVSESNNFIGGSDASRLGTNRALFVDDTLGGGAGEKFKPYAAPTPEALTILQQKLASVAR